MIFVLYSILNIICFFVWFLNIKESHAIFLSWLEIFFQKFIYICSCYRNFHIKHSSLQIDFLIIGNNMDTRNPFAILSYKPVIGFVVIYMFSFSFGWDRQLDTSFQLIFIITSLVALSFKSSIETELWNAI